jgi:hypothetical protein
MENGEPSKGHGHEVPVGGKFKAEAFADTGISTSTAHRYEELTGGREEQGQKAARVAAEKYFAEQKQAEQSPYFSAV